MRYGIFLLATGLLFSCKQKTEPAYSTTSTSASAGTSSYGYKAEDGSRAKATFNSADKTLVIEANNTKFQLDDKGNNLYERNGISARAFGDSLIITQQDNVIELVRDK